MHSTALYVSTLVFGATAISASRFSHPFTGSALLNRQSPIDSGCGTSGPASCQNSSAVSDLCCFESPGGLLVLPQFWDTNPVNGPDDSWTIHGLWPDHCDGTWDEDCDPSRAYTDISGLLSGQGASDTLEFMQTYWVDIDGDNEDFWEHEWSTHGTCMSTLEPDCLPNGSEEGAEAVAYFQQAVAVFQSLPTYQWLANQGITPDDSATYTLNELISALRAESGVEPALDCRSGAVNQIYWYFNVRGSVIDGEFELIDAPDGGSCGSSGIRYPTKNGGGGTPTTTTSTPTGTALPARATIQALVGNSFVGGLLSAGTWSTQTLATFTISGSANSFTMTSSRGRCGVSGGSLACGSSVTSTAFSAVASGGRLFLASNGQTAWTSSGRPSGTAQLQVTSGSGLSQDYQLVIGAN